MVHTATDFAGAVEGIAALGREQVGALISGIVDLDGAAAAFASLVAESDGAWMVLVHVGG